MPSDSGGIKRGDRYIFFSIIQPLFIFYFMAKKIRITLTQVMAILALIGILIGVIGTSVLYSIPTAAKPEVTAIASDEATK